MVKHHALESFLMSEHVSTNAVLQNSTPDGKNLRHWNLECSIFYSIANLLFGEKLLQKTEQYQRNVKKQILDINVIFSKVSVLCPCINYGENN